MAVTRIIPEVRRQDASATEGLYCNVTAVSRGGSLHRCPRAAAGRAADDKALGYPKVLLH